MSSMEKLVAPRKADTSGSSGKDKAITVGTPAVELNELSNLPGIMPSVEKSFAPRKADTSRSSGKDKASTAGTIAVELKTEPALTIAYTPQKRDDIEADIVLVGGVDGPDPLSDSWFNRQTNVHWPSQLLPTDVPTARVLRYHYTLDTNLFSARLGKVSHYGFDPIMYSSPRPDNNLEWYAEELVAELVRVRGRDRTVSDHVRWQIHANIPCSKTERSYL